MRESIVETIIGLAVVIAAGVFLWFALDNGTEAGASTGESYELGARFENVAGISRGTDVRLAGVKVGTVREVNLDAERYQAQIVFSVDGSVELDSDTSMRVQSDGLLGGAYLGIEPGGGYDIIAPCPDGEVLFGETGCGEILYTRGSVDLLTLFASFASGSGSESDSAPAPDADPYAVDGE